MKTSWLMDKGMVGLEAFKNLSRTGLKMADFCLQKGSLENIAMEAMEFDCKEGMV